MSPGERSGTGAEEYLLRVLCFESILSSRGYSRVVGKSLMRAGGAIQQDLVSSGPRANSRFGRNGCSLSLSRLEDAPEPRHHRTPQAIIHRL